MTRRYTGGFISAKEQATDSNTANGIFTLAEAQEKTALGNFPTGRWTPQRSLRFRSSASAYLSRILPASGNLTTWTWSSWCKLGAFSNGFCIFQGQTGGTSSSANGLQLRSDQTLQFFLNNSGGTTVFNKITTQVFRDPSAWYHIVLTYDTTNTVAEERIRIYVNGVRVTSFSSNTTPSSNQTSYFNQTGYNQLIGKDYTTSYYDGYMSEVNFIDGQALDSTYFGQTDPETGTWVPKRYTGTYGNNGFYLPFNDNTSLNTIALDKSLLSTELITNGNFNSDVSGWTVSPGVGGSPSITLVSGAARIANSQNNAVIYYQAIPTTIGNTYYVRGYVSNISIGGSTRLCKIQWSTTLGSGFNDVGSVSQATGSGWISGTFVATATTTYIYLNVDVLGAGTQGADWDNISVSETGYKNHFNTSGISLSLYSNYDSMTDVPGIAAASSRSETGNITRGNYNTWNPLTNTRAGGTISDANLTTSGSLNNRPLMLGTQYFSSGKWYCEVWCGAFGHSGDNKAVGITTVRGQTETIGSSVLFTYGTGIIRAFANSNNNSLDYRDGYGNTIDQGQGQLWWVDGFWIGFAVDIDNDTMSIYKNGTLSAKVTGCGLGGKEWTYFWEPESSASRTPATGWYWNFGQQPFVYTPPAGHKGLCTTNLPNPVIKKPSDHFDVKTYTGNGTALTVGTTAKQTSAYQISRSLRFKGSSNYLSRTPASAGNRRTWTWSCWVKRNQLQQNDPQRLLYVGNGSTSETSIYYTGNRLQLEYYVAPTNYYIRSYQLSFADTSSWVHVMVAVDTTQAVTGNRVLLYCNGTKVNNFHAQSQPTQNFDMRINEAAEHWIGGRTTANSEWLAGYMADTYFIDGQQLTPSSFGQYDANNNWVPRPYTGTYGTNGYYLPFSTLGTSSYAGLLASNSTYLTAPTNAAFSIGTGDFTMETWFYPTSSSQTGQILFVASGGIQMGYQNSSTWGLCQANVAWQTTTTTLPTTNAWNHMAITRSGTTVGVFLNGSRVASGTISTSYSQNTCVIGQGIVGYLSNTRMVKGTAVYNPSNTTYTVPTSPLTNVAGTSVLTFQNSTNIDNSSNAFTLTATGSVPDYVAYPFSAGQNNAVGLGADSSGAANHWIPNNISTIVDSTCDTMFDSPTDYGTDTGAGGEVGGNYCTLNGNSRAYTDITVANAGLQATFGSATGWELIPGTISMTTGKWYWECSVSQVAGYGEAVGLIDDSDTFVGGGLNYCGYRALGYGWAGHDNAFRHNNVSLASPGTYAANDILGCAYDADTRKFWVRVNNGAWVLSGNPSTGANPIAVLDAPRGYGYYPACSGYNSTVATINFGQRPFAYTAPTGFKALNTKNLKDVGAYNLPDNYGNVVNTPDLVWTKSRNASVSPRIYDVARGPGYAIGTNSTNGSGAETYQGLTAFIPNGFQLYSPNGAAPYGLENGTTYVAWMWNRGQIPGFDIVTYGGNGGTQLIPHNLGVAPKFIVVKKLSSATNSNWMVQHASLGPATALNLNNTSQSGTTYWGSTAPSSTTFTVDSNANYNASGDSFIAYLWAEVPGFSKFGSWINNNSNDGAFIHTGFRPKFILMKNTDNVERWFIQDSVRSPYNYATGSGVYIDPTVASAEGTNGATSAAIDFVSNGFKIRSSNTAAGEISYGTRTYVYAAFAEAPFKYANAR